MTEPLSFIVGGPPIPAARHRFDSRSGRMHMDGRSEGYKRHVAGVAATAATFAEGTSIARRDPPWPVPAACARARARALGRRKRPTCECGWCAARYRVEIHVVFGDRRARDVDNFSKNVLDACNGVLWLDDSQVQEIVVRKSVNPEHPRAEVRVVPVAAQAAIQQAQ